MILAGVTLSLALNSNGVFQRSKNAAAAYSEAEELERAELDQVSKDIDLSLGKLPEGSTLVDAYKAGFLKVGDYINYKASQEKEFISTETGDATSNGYAVQTYKVKDNKNEGRAHEITWRILGLANDDGELVEDDDETGKHIMLISGSPVERVGEDPRINFKGAEGFVNYSNILDGICNIYKNDDFAELGRSIKIEDINTRLGVVVENNIVHLKGSDEDIDDCYTKYLGITREYSDEEYTPESYLKGITAKENGETVSLGNVYQYKTDEFKDKKIGNTTYGELFFNIGEEFSKVYWTNYKSVLVGGDRTLYGGAFILDGLVGTGSFYTMTFSSSGEEGECAIYFGVRPVISLKSDILYEGGGIEKISPQEEPDWYQLYGGLE